MFNLCTVSIVRSACYMCVVCDVHQLVQVGYALCTRHIFEKAVNKYGVSTVALDPTGLKNKDSLASVGNLLVELGLVMGVYDAADIASVPFGDALKPQKHAREWCVWYHVTRGVVSIVCRVACLPPCLATQPCRGCWFLQLAPEVCGVVWVILCVACRYVVCAEHDMLLAPHINISTTRASWLVATVASMMDTKASPRSLRASMVMRAVVKSILSDRPLSEVEMRHAGCWVQNASSAAMVNYFSSKGAAAHLSGLVRTSFSCMHACTSILRLQYILGC